MLTVFFAGTPDCAVPALQAITEKYHVVGVLTNPPAAAGRTRKPIPSAVFSAAQTLKQQQLLKKDIPIFTPEKLDNTFREAVRVLKPDIMVCFAFGKIFGPKMLALFPKGALNIHPSLLPRWRGPSPIPAAIAAGDTITGVTIQCMAAQMDAGDIVLQEQLPITPLDTAESLLTRCSHIGAQLILQALEKIENGSVHYTAQDDTAATYCNLLRKEDGCINWGDAVSNIDCKIRAYTPWPGAFTYWHGVKLLIKQASAYSGSVKNNTTEVGCVIGTDEKEGILIQTSDGILAVSILQRQGKKVMHWKDFLNGAGNFIGEHLE